MITGGIFGPKRSGKTTLARRLSVTYWERLGVASLVLDPHKEKWGSQAWVTADEKKFWKTVWSTRGYLVICEEAAQTIARDRELMTVFTRLNHQGHILLVIGHSGADLLPGQRQQFDTLYLFRQPKSAAETWAEVFTEDGLLEAKNLKQYEFIYCELYRKPEMKKLPI